MLTIREVDEREHWNASLRELPYAHVLQTWEWGEFKRGAGRWTPLRLAFERDGRIVAMASLLTRSMGPLKVMYLSKGPALDYADVNLAQHVFSELERRMDGFGNVWLKADPDVIAATGLPNTDEERIHKEGRDITGTLRGRGWRFSDSQVQFRNTLTIDLRRSEDEILAAMSGNTRRKIRVAAKKGVTIRPATIDDLPLLYQLYQVTGARDKFLIRSFAYYRRAWEQFMRAGLAQALIAEHKGVAIAHVILFHFGSKCWYFYGASANAERERMPNYALQWSAIRWAKARGYQVYDMWGAPDTFDKSDSMWGVYQFKRGFRGELTRHIGAWDFAVHPTLYYIYHQFVPRVLGGN
jgi:lipid II:glycine glycyltransferase (peptidoglycan interpeptide bridge formation enzyme)